MTSRVGTLRCRYRTHGPALAPAVFARLDRVAAERLPTELDPTLSEFSADGAVYIVRRVHARTTVNPAAAADPVLAHRWGRDLARSVARAIIHDPGDGANVVRFASEAEFVAAFVADLLTGTAWQRWYFGAFARHRHQPAARAIETLLAEHRHDLPAILAALARRDMLESLLATIDARVLSLSNAASGHPDGSPDVQGWRPLLAAATHLISTLDLWAAAAPEATALLHRWAATGHEQPDWRDRAALTDTVTAIIRWLVRTGLARTPGPDHHTRLDAAMAGLDWLDLPRLTAALTIPPTGDAGLPGRGAATTTPRQRDLLTALERAIRDQHPNLEPSAPSSPANAARLLAALAQTEPTWAADPLAPVLIHRILTAWAAHTGAPPHPDASAAREALAAVARLGEPATAVLAALEDSIRAGSGDMFTSPVAGLLLLQRVLLDVRLAGLAERHGYPPAGPGYLLAAVGLRWAGPSGKADRRLDPAIRLLAGDESPQSIAELDAAWRAVSPAAHAAWRSVLDDLAARHQLTAVAAADDPLDHTAHTLLRIWARWLRDFEHSSPSYLLDQFVHRPGTVVVAPDRITVQLSRRPLDTVLEIAGYLRPIEALSGLASRRTEFQVGELR